MRIRRATSQDNPAILALLENTPQPGAMSLTFERRPDYFRGAAITCEEPEVWVAETDGPSPELGAVYNVGRRRVWVNGDCVPIRYAHDLRIAPRHQGSRLLFRLFRTLKTTLHEAEWMQTVILRDNGVSRNTVASGRAGLPVYYPFGAIETSVIHTRPGRFRAPAGLTVRAMTGADRGALLALLEREGPRKQFFPRLDLSELHSSPYFHGLSLGDWVGVWQGTTLKGVLGSWNQSDIKQTRVNGYRGALEWLRPLLNATRPLHGGLRLPAPGECLSFVTLHTLVTENNDPQWLAPLLEHAVHAHHRDHGAVVCGFFTQDPLRDAVRGFRRRTLFSDHYLVSYGEDPRPRLQPDRIPYVEVARL